MFRRSRRRFTILLLLALALLPAWPAAASSGEIEPAWSRAFQSLDLALRLWKALAGLWGESGCSVDPSGTCFSGPQAGATGEAGCSLDPSGTCADRAGGGAPAENGCSVDPSGECGADTTTSDAGCSADPNGYCGD